MTDVPRTGVVCSLATRLRMTEGQLYSSAIALLSALVLSLQLGGVHGLPTDSTDLTAGPGLTPVPVAQQPAVAVAPQAPPVGPDVVLSTGPLPLPTPVPQSPLVFTSPEAAPPQPGPTFATEEPTPAPSPCSAQPVFGPAESVLTLVTNTSGGLLPTEAIVAALSQTTGCRSAATAMPVPLP